MMERRLFARVCPAPDSPIRVDLSGADFLDVFDAMDISRGGLGSSVGHSFDDCRTERIVDCLVQLPLPIRRSFRAQGKMRHIEGGRFGIEFINLNEKNQQLIDSYVDQQLQTQHWWDWLVKRRGFSSASNQYLH